jgi:hypothetical protein
VGAGGGQEAQDGGARVGVAGQGMDVMASRARPGA